MAKSPKSILKEITDILIANANETSKIIIKRNIEIVNKVKSFVGSCENLPQNKLLSDIIQEAAKESVLPEWFWKNIRKCIVARPGESLLSPKLISCPYALIVECFTHFNVPVKEQDRIIGDGIVEILVYGSKSKVCILSNDHVFRNVSSWFSAKTCEFIPIEKQIEDFNKKENQRKIVREETAERRVTKQKVYFYSNDSSNSFFIQVGSGAKYPVDMKDVISSIQSIAVSSLSGNEKKTAVSALLKLEDLSWGKGSPVK